MADHGVANPQDGEMTIRLGGREHRIRPSFGAAAAIEAELGVGLCEVADRLSLGRATIRETAVVLRHGLIAGGAEPTPKLEAVEGLVFDTGLIGVRMVAARFVLACLNGGRVPGEATAGGSGAATSPTAGT